MRLRVKDPPKCLPLKVKKKNCENKLKYSACKTHLRFRNGCQKLEQKKEEQKKSKFHEQEMV